MQRDPITPFLSRLSSALFNGARVRYRGDMRASLEVHLALTAERQFGLFTRTQAQRAGASHEVIARRLASGRWEQVAPGVLAIAGVPASWERNALAACLAWGDGARLSHGAAGAAHGLLDRPRSRIELAVPRGRRRRTMSGLLVHERVRLPEPTFVGPLPATSVPRTLLDLATVLDADPLELVVEDAVRRGLTNLRRVREEIELDGARGQSGARVLRAVLARATPHDMPSESVLETLAFQALRRRRLPEPVRQFEIRDPSGVVVARVDFAYPAERIAIEADGYAWHSGRIRWERDLARRNWITALGWRVLHVTWRELMRDPDGFAQRVADLLAS